LAIGLGDAALVPVDALPVDAALVMLATWRSPSIAHSRYHPRHHQRALELLAVHTETQFAGLVNCRAGAEETMLGWVQSAGLGIRLVDVVLDPSLFLSTVLGAAEPWRETDDPISLSVVGSGGSSEWTAHAAPRELVPLLHQLAGCREGDLALALGPFSRSWLAAHGRPNLLSHAMDVGREIVTTGDGDGSLVAGTIGRMLGGQLVASCSVVDVVWQNAGVGEVATIHLRDGQSRELQLLFFTRYVALDVDGSRIATLPDALITVGTRGTPLTARELSRGEDVHILLIPGERLAPVDPTRLAAVSDQLAALTGKPIQVQVGPARPAGRKGAKGGDHHRSVLKRTPTDHPSSLYQETLKEDKR
jgi:DUF917 family protein